MAQLPVPQNVTVDIYRYRGTPMQQIKAYLDRFQPSQWPTDGD
jgi:hypothetical protein